MAQTLTTLAKALAANATTVYVTAATGATVGGYLKMDDEMAVILSIAGTTFECRRGLAGTAQVAHNILAPVAVGVGSDFPEPGPGTGRGVSPRAVVSYGASGAITVPMGDTVVLLTKATAAAMTLGQPTGVPNGTMLYLAATTAAAHTITLTVDVFGAGDSSEIVYTFGGNVGETLTLMAYKNLWAEVNRAKAADESPLPLLAGS